MKPSRFIAALAAVFVACSVCQADDSQVCGCQKPAACMNHGCGGCCLLMCCPEIKTVKEKTHGWEADCEYVCVPKVQCPSLLTLLGLRKSACLSCDECGSADCQGQCLHGESCRPSQACGRIRCVKKLRKVETEKEKQVVEWTVKQCAMDYGKCCHGNAPALSCAPQW